MENLMQETKDDSNILMPSFQSCITVSLLPFYYTVLWLEGVIFTHGSNHWNLQIREYPLA